MDAVAERHVEVVLASDVVGVGVGEGVGVAVAGGQHGEHAGSGRDDFIRHLGVLLDASEQHLHRAVVAERLLDRLREQFLVGHQPIELIGVAAEGEGHVGDETHRRFVAGDEQQHARGHDFSVGHDLFAVRFDHATDEIVGRVGLALLDLVAEVEVELRAEAARRFGIGSAPHVGTGHRLGPDAELGPVFSRDAEQFGDHNGREGCGEVGDDVEGFPRPERGEQLGADLANSRFERGDRTRREGPVDDPAEALVVGRVGGEHRLGAHELRPGHAGGVVGPFGPGRSHHARTRRAHAEPGVVAVDLPHVVVAVDDVRPEACLQQTAGLPHPLIGRVRVAGQAMPEGHEVEIHHGHGGSFPRPPAGCNRSTNL